MFNLLFERRLIHSVIDSFLTVGETAVFFPVMCMLSTPALRERFHSTGTTLPAMVKLFTSTSELCPHGGTRMRCWPRPWPLPQLVLSAGCLLRMARPSLGRGLQCVCWPPPPSAAHHAMCRTAGDYAEFGMAYTYSRVLLEFSLFDGSTLAMKELGVVASITAKVGLYPTDELYCSVRRAWRVSYSIVVRFAVPAPGHRLRRRCTRRRGVTVSRETRTAAVAAARLVQGWLARASAAPPPHLRSSST